LHYAEELCAGEKIQNSKCKSQKFNYYKSLRGEKRRSNLFYFILSFCHCKSPEASGEMKQSLADFVIASPALLLKQTLIYKKTKIYTIKKPTYFLM